MTAGSPEAATFLAALGKRVSSRRDALSISQRELARRAGMHWSYIATIETGKRNIGVVNLARLAGALGYEDVGELVTGLSL